MSKIIFKQKVYKMNVIIVFLAVYCDGGLKMIRMRFWHTISQIRNSVWEWDEHQWWWWWWSLRMMKIMSIWPCEWANSWLLIQLSVNVAERSTLETAIRGQSEGVDLLSKTISTGWRWMDYPCLSPPSAADRTVGDASHRCRWCIGISVFFTLSNEWMNEWGTSLADFIVANHRHLKQEGEDYNRELKNSMRDSMRPNRAEW